MYATSTFITEALHLVTQVQLLLTTVTVNERLIQRYLTLSGLVTMMHANAKATPINDNDYSHHMTPVELV